MEESTLSQEKRILKHFIQGGKLTALGALTKFGCLQFHARLNGLREKYIIQSEWIKLDNGKRIKRYWI